MRPDAHKVLIYATWRDSLLVFDQPDFPEVDLQVPGGTMEPGESPEAAARREFFEETGLAPREPFAQLATLDYRFVKSGSEIWHRRLYFHTALVGEQRQSWLHDEMTPDSGGPPIRFRFFWVSQSDASSRLGYGMNEALALLQKPAAVGPSPRV
ncbi:8-oxo-dGTP pyrophosphatase MutT (NUDIX family) [Sinorhizobium fredii]|jgi:8-oxo-dGTP pyrophosphatase MutT (NUDIX family)|uniref:NTP pyrophosphohydrolase MutT family n=1 Tax=Sinorhizobium fredii (strain USDA 257) TaxID=1185652 RepID=I3XEA5_SINF2|nr:NUDIX domain-containing protein [Sinorhizobium fredii]AFL54211.1 NTP pyrophosphohydrolase MutT family [Sinorhizobium fredii USDA 257]